MRHRVGERLTRMLFVGQRVDDVQPWRRVGQQLGTVPARTSGRTSARTQRSRLRATSSSGSRPPANSVEQVQHVAAELLDGDFERRARAQRRLLEQQRHVRSVERCRGRCLAGPAAGRPSAARPDRSSRHSAAGVIEIENREEVLRPASRLGTVSMRR